IEGKMFVPMALTVIFALLGSLLLSLTYVPAMMTLILRGKVSEKESFLIRWAKKAYAPALAFVGRWRAQALAVAVALVFIS
ncbi:efflux RND transporter permease subunit, partial [Escherichia coli]|nr:efflux RND transporter permease subunit [Escherichia coli]